MSENNDQALEIMPERSDAYIANAEAMGLSFMNPVRWKAMQVMAQTFVQSGALPSTIRNAPQLIMVFQAGYEHGLQPIESINAFYFVNGKLTMYGDQVIAQVIKAGHKVEWGKCDDKTASVKITRADGGGSYEDTFTWEMAKSRGLVNAIYTKYPNHMLKYKVFSMVAKFIVPDALKGVQIGENEDMLRESIASEIISEKKSHRAEPKTEKELDAAIDEALEEAEHTPLNEVLSKPTEKPVADKKVTKKVSKNEK